MEAFKVRLIQEYNELNERIGKLSNFLKNPNGVELSEKMMAVIVLSVWGYTLLSKKIDYVYGNQSILYQKILEAEIPVLCSYLGVLETARREALADERYEDVQRLIETIRYNTGTLEQLRREYSMMRKDSQSTR